ncbi:hypothetical protein Trydic_g5616 [Trypoxylus dichotomus]
MVTLRIRMFSIIQDTCHSFDEFRTMFLQKYWGEIVQSKIRTNLTMGKFDPAKTSSREEYICIIEVFDSRQYNVPGNDNTRRPQYNQHFQKPTYRSNHAHVKRPPPPFRPNRRCVSYDRLYSLPRKSVYFRSTPPVRNTDVIDGEILKKQLAVQASNPIMGCVKKLSIPASELFSRQHTQKVVQFHLCLLQDGGYMDEKGVLNRNKIKEIIGYNIKSARARERIERCLRIEHKSIGLKAVKLNQCLTPLS